MDITHKIQIAGIHDWEEAELVRSCRADFLGFPLRLPVNAVDLTEDEAAEIIQKSPLPSILITYQNKADDIIDFCNQMGCQNIQLHGKIDTQELEKLKKKTPNTFVIKSLVVSPEKENLNRLKQQIDKQQDYVDAFILDTHNPATGADGATGLTHDWTISRELVQYSPKPVIMAGGMTPENVAEAILCVRPAAVDVHTAVEAENGRKCPQKLDRFIREAKRAFALL
jgi:phosphoribosylanthranilate isomerase